MRIGTRSLLFGAHQVLIHPWFVAAAWWRLFGFPWDLRLWVAFVVHDWGYWRKPNMDGPEGETHPELGAWIMGHLFGPEWHDFTLRHSRFYARRLNRPVSRLCYADKLAIAETWLWLWLPMVRLTGELAEYRGETRPASAGWVGKAEESDHTWALRVQAYNRAWVMEHVDGRPDSWTPSASEVVD